MRLKVSRWPALGVALEFLLCGAPARLDACQICLPFPTTSAAEHLLEAEVVVLAREDPVTPFSLRAVEVLKGDSGDAPIDLFLDSQSRRLLSLNPNRKIVCTYRTNGPEAGWNRVGTADHSFGPLVRAILDHAAEWECDPQKRWQFFAEYLDHKNGQVSSLAHLEVAKAPYDQIRKFGDAIPIENLRAFLQNIRLIEWHALYILLLAQSEEAQDHELIEERVRNASRFGTTLQLAAWTTAWIEVEPETALAFLEENYLRNAGRKLDEVKAILGALSVHGTRGHVQFRDRIVEGYRDLLTGHPPLALQIVTDLMAWKRWDLAKTVGAIVDDPPPNLDRVVILQLRSYIRMADGGESGGVSGPGGPEGRRANLAFTIVFVVLILVPVGLSVISRLRRTRVSGP